MIPLIGQHPGVNIEITVDPINDVLIIWTGFDGKRIPLNLAVARQLKQAADKIIDKHEQLTRPLTGDGSEHEAINLFRRSTG